MTLLNDTNDPALKSWVASANEVGCTSQSRTCPSAFFAALGPMRPIGEGSPSEIKSWFECCVGGELLSGAAAKACEEPTLNTLMSLGRPAWSDLRRSCLPCYGKVAAKRLAQPASYLWPMQK